MILIIILFAQIRVHKAGFVPGETLDLTVEIRNDSSKDLRLNISLVQQCNMTVSNCPRLGFSTGSAIFKLFFKGARDVRSGCP